MKQGKYSWLMLAVILAQVGKDYCFLDNVQFDKMFELKH